MTPLYAGIGGVVRELTEMDAGINGVVTPLTEMWAGVDGVNRQIFSAGTTAGSLSVGDVVKINENGVAQDYLCVHQGLPSSLYDSSCDGTWLLRKDIIENRVWDSGNVNSYFESDIRNWLQETMLTRYDADLQQAISKRVRIPYCIGKGNNLVVSGANGVIVSCFLLSGFEVGFTEAKSEYMPEDGAKLSYFESGTGASASNKRVANLSGSASSWWTRSSNTAGGTAAWRINPNGNSNAFSCYLEYGVRPAFILPKDFILPQDSIV